MSSATARVDVAALERRLRWLCRAPMLPARDPESDAAARTAALRAIAHRVAAAGGDVVAQVAAVQVALAPAELERADRLLTHLTRNNNPRRNR